MATDAIKVTYALRDIHTLKGLARHMVIGLTLCNALLRYFIPATKAKQHIEGQR